MWYYRNPTEDEIKRWQQELRILELDYRDQPAFQRRRDLVLINQLRERLSLPPVDDYLRPIVVELVPEELIVEPVIEAIAPPPSNRPILIQRVLEYSVQLQFTMQRLQSRIRELFKTNIPLDTLTELQLHDFITFLQQELNAKLLGDQLLNEYAATEDKREGFTLERLQTLRCSRCGELFPLESSHHVPFISGGLVVLADEKGAVFVYHGYEGQPETCYGQALREILGQ